jgi:hypothetical protein
MSKQDNEAIVGPWFTKFWGENCNLAVVDAVAAPDMLLKYSLHEPRKVQIGQSRMSFARRGFAVGICWPCGLWISNPASSPRQDAI